MCFVATAEACLFSLYYVKLLEGKTRDYRHSKVKISASKIFPRQVLNAHSNIIEEEKIWEVARSI